MSILNHFKIKAKVNYPAELPDPNGPLSAAVPSSTIAAVNKKVSSTMEKFASTDKSRGPYSHLTDEQKYCMGKRASEFGVTNTMRYYLKTFPVNHRHLPNFSSPKLLDAQFAKIFPHQTFPLYGSCQFCGDQIFVHFIKFLIHGNYMVFKVQYLERLVFRYKNINLFIQLQ